MKTSLSVNYFGINISQRFGRGAPGPCSSATHGRRSKAPVASYCDGPMAHVSDIKLIRTDTTLDLSQKAEKGMI